MVLCNCIFSTPQLPLPVTPCMPKFIWVLNSLKKLVTIFLVTHIGSWILVANGDIRGWGQQFLNDPLKYN